MWRPVFAEVFLIQGGVAEFLKKRFHFNVAFGKKKEKELLASINACIVDSMDDERARELIETFIADPPLLEKAPIITALNIALRRFANPAVRMLAAKALGKVRAPITCYLAIKCLGESLLEENDPQVCGEIAYSLQVYVMVASIRYLHLAAEKVAEEIARLSLRKDDTVLTNLLLKQDIIRSALARLAAKIQFLINEQTPASIDDKLRAYKSLFHESLFISPLDLLIIGTRDKNMYEYCVKALMDFNEPAITGALSLLAERETNPGRKKTILFWRDVVEKITAEKK